MLRSQVAPDTRSGVTRLKHATFIPESETHPTFAIARVAETCVRDTPIPMPTPLRSSATENGHENGGHSH